MTELQALVKQIQQKPFKYEGSIKEGSSIYFGWKVKVAGSHYSTLHEKFNGQTLAIGASRTTPPKNEKGLTERILFDIHNMTQVINDKEYLNNLAAETQRKQKQVQQMLNKIEDEINVSKAKKKRYLEKLAENQITQEEYREVADEHQGRINELNIKRSGLEASLRHDEFLGRIENLRNTINRFLPHYEVTEEILHHFVGRIDVDRNGTPAIIYRFSILPG